MKEDATTYQSQTEVEQSDAVVENPMNETAVTQPESETEKSEVHTRNPRAKYNVFALASIILAPAAWIILSFDGPVSLGVAVVAFVCGCIGLKASTRSWRNTAITAIVASAVLMVVLTAFLIVLFVGLESV